MSIGCRLDRHAGITTTRNPDPGAGLRLDHRAQRSGTLEIQDGPFADTKERVGGVFVIDVPGLDAAIGWPAKAPAAQWGSVEVRPTAIFWTRDRGWFQP